MARIRFRAALRDEAARDDFAALAHAWRMLELAGMISLGAVLAPAKIGFASEGNQGLRAAGYLHSL